MASRDVKQNATDIATKNVSSSVVMWDTAIQEALERIDRKKRDIAGLRASVRIFEARRDAGEPWPGKENLR